ncbi:hypothetical protein DPMN_126801 [Dreissena polymorpha]|uniref:Uncharacterized protein n=1 Tax=Dreissena polymorpha TaxID=45954 RepID=A0A9D4GWG3_DREPO|nr:hypothetical protein DPMN_126801 [Dreissena polymorpha]
MERRTEPVGGEMEKRMEPVGEEIEERTERVGGEMEGEEEFVLQVEESDDGNISDGMISYLISVLIQLVRLLPYSDFCSLGDLRELS